MIRRFEANDAQEVANLIARTLRETNIKDYSTEYIENDEYFLRAKRVEIPASITACNFYRKFGYDYKNGINVIDDEQLYRLEKYR